MTSDARKLAWMASLRVEGETMITKPIHYWTLWRGKREYLLFYFTKHRRFELNFIVNSREISTLTHLAASIALHCLPPEGIRRGDRCLHHPQLCTTEIIMNVQDKILAAQTALLWDHPFFGVLLLQLEKVDATKDPRITTMATDGRRLYYHEPFVMGLKKEELVFVLAHEVMHNALEHHIRRQHRKPGRWNKAADYAINGELVECKVGKMPECGLINPNLTGLSSEEIYRILDEENNGDASDENSMDGGGCGGVIDGCASHDEAGRAELAAEMQAQVRQAAMVAKASQAGKLPAGLQRLIDEILMPKVDWRAVLRRFIDESMTRDFSWSNPNRRLLPMGIVTPGTISCGVSHIVIAVDTSGSIDEEILKDFAAEVNGAYQEGGVDKLTVIYADAAVAHIEQFENGDELILHPAGGGGTAFSDTFEKIEDQFPDARATIYLTDMYVGDFGEQPSMPVLWGVYGRDSKDFATLSPPFGESINISI